MSIYSPIGTMIPVAMSGGTGPLLDIPPVTQQQSNWCWSACGEMIFNYLHEPTRVDQSLLAEALLGMHCTADPGRCDVGISISQLLDLYSIMAVRYQALSGSLSASKLRLEIDQKRPVHIGILWSSGSSGHMILLRGYVDDPTEGLWIDINDPLQKADATSVSTESESYWGCSYDELLSYLGGTWLWSFAELQPETP